MGRPRGPRLMLIEGHCTLVNRGDAAAAADLPLAAAARAPRSLALARCWTCLSKRGIRCRCWVRAGDLLQPRQRQITDANTAAPSVQASLAAAIQANEVAPMPSIAAGLVSSSAAAMTAARTKIDARRRLLMRHRSTHRRKRRNVLHGWTLKTTMVLACPTPTAVVKSQVNTTIWPPRQFGTGRDTQLRHPPMWEELRRHPDHRACDSGLVSTQWMTVH